MSKIAELLLAFSLCVSLCACGGSNSADTSNEMSIAFQFGERTGEYIGETDSNGLPDGYGVFSSARPDGTAWTYAGEWDHGHWNGSGTTKWETGEVHAGQYTGDTETGYGVYTTETGCVIAGYFVDRVATGYCAVYLSGEYDGYVFWGNHLDGEATGIVYSPDGLSAPATYIDGKVSFDPNDFAASDETPKTETIVEESTSPATEPPIETAQKDEITTGMRNALRSAEQYLSFTSFSRSGLIEQLKFDQYTASEAEYAVDNCGADWYEQAEKSAKKYLDFMSFSRGGLIDQLVFDGFTRDQAEHGADANGL